MAENDTMTTGDDPADYTADQVKAHLATADPAEFDRVLAAERDGKARVSVLNYSQDPTPPEDATPGEDMPEPDGDGYTRVVISSPEMDRTDAEDAGDGEGDTA